MSAIRFRKALQVYLFLIMYIINFEQCLFLQKPKFKDEI